MEARCYQQTSVKPTSKMSHHLTQVAEVYVVVFKGPNLADEPCKGHYDAIGWNLVFQI